jgi:hypothetical protein
MVINMRFECFSLAVSRWECGFNERHSVNIGDKDYYMIKGLQGTTHVVSIL